MPAIDAQKLVVSLRGYFWHSTSVSGAYAITKDGAIRVNKSGAFPFSYPQSAVSNCVSLGGVSLFDFVTHSDKDMVGEDLLLSDKWPDVLILHRPCTLAFGFRLRDIADSLLFYPELKQMDGIGGAIPRVEACYRGDLSIARVSAIGVCFPDRDGAFTVKKVLPEELAAEVAKVRDALFEKTEPNSERSDSP